MKASVTWTLVASVAVALVSLMAVADVLVVRLGLPCCHPIFRK